MSALLIIVDAAPSLMSYPEGDLMFKQLGRYLEPDNRSLGFGMQLTINP